MKIYKIPSRTTVQLCRCYGDCRDTNKCREYVKTSRDWFFKVPGDEYCSGYDDAQGNFILYPTLVKIKLPNEWQNITGFVCLRKDILKCNI